MRTRTTMILGSILFLLMGVNGSAQDIERIQTGEPRKELPEREFEKESDIEMTKKAAEKAKVSELTVSEGKKIASSFIIKGNTVIRNDELYDLAEEYRGKDLTITDLNTIASLVTKEYWNRGYITSLAYVPEQKVIDGTVTILVLEGLVGEVFVENNKRFTESYIRRQFADIDGEHVILNSKDLERGLLTLNDHPTLTMKAALTKGAKPMTTNVTLTADEKSMPVSGSVFYNNHGTRYTGTSRVGASLTIDNPLKLGDMLTLSGTMKAFNSRDLGSGRVAYDLPVGNMGTKLHADYSVVRYRIREEFNTLGIRSSGHNYGFSITQPLIKERNKNLTAIVGLKKKNYKNYMFENEGFSTKDRYAVGYIGVSGDIVRMGSHSFVATNITSGLGSLFGGMNSASYDKSSRPGRATDHWMKFDLDATHIMKLFEKNRLIARGSAQIASRPLLIGEQFTIGGPDSVRGFGAGEALGDHGYFLSLEVRTPLLVGEHKINDHVNLAFFGDHGQTFYEKALSGDKKVVLSSVGFGARITAKEKFTVKADVAFPVGTHKAGDRKSTRFWISAGMNF